MTARITCPSALLLLVSSLAAAAPLAPGLEKGQRPGPYSSVVSVGEQRGRSHCFICETGDRPAVLVFARSLSDPLGKLLGKLDRAVADGKPGELRCWATFLHPDQSAFDAPLVAWGKKHALRAVPLTVFEDTEGPPSYRLARDADVIVVAFVRQKVFASFAFRAGELSDQRIAEILQVLPTLKR